MFAFIRFALVWSDNDLLSVQVMTQSQVNGPFWKALPTSGVRKMCDALGLTDLGLVTPATVQGAENRGSVMLQVEVVAGILEDVHCTGRPGKVRAKRGAAYERHVECDHWADCKRAKLQRLTQKSNAA